jgi:hypothetical protein
MCLSIAIKSPQNVLAKGKHLGFEWTVTHNDIGYRCGYVRVPLGHPWHGKGYELDVDVHGGITFSQSDVPCDAPGADTDWWVGFDCGHSGDAPDQELSSVHWDIPPILGALYGNFGQVRSQSYVEAECKSLCAQAKEAALAMA